MRSRSPLYRQALLLASLLAVVATPGVVAAENTHAGGSAQAGRAGLQGVAGRVLSHQDPLSAAKVYAFQIADASLYKAVTNQEGGFEFRDLPVGLYKVIAHKRGFVPAVVMLTRATSDAYQFVEVRLAPDSVGEVASGEDFWSVRAEIPPDVLREIAVAEVEDVARAGVTLPDGVRLSAEISAMAGVDQVASLGETQSTAGGVGIEGRIGDVRIDLDGGYRHLAGSGVAAGPGGETSRLSLRVGAGRDTQVQVTSTSNRLDPLERQAAGPVDFEHYRVSVSTGLGDRGHSEFAAQYTSENSFHRHGWVDPLDIPAASESWRLEGSYASALGGQTSLETGFRYRARRYGAETGTLFRPPSSERMELYGRGGSQVQPAVFVEYGLYTTLHDGSLSLAPRGGMVIDLGRAWKAATTVSHRVHSEPEPFRDFVPVLHGEGDGCDQGEKSCYRVVFSHTGRDEEEQITLGAVHRELAETLRLYFSEDFFDRLESLYLVPGDELPELQLSLTRRLAPQVLARFEGNVASGGGGIFYATDREAYENAVRYLVASMDTRFTGTDTGLFLAFHHLEQDLSPVAGGTAPAPLEIERLQVMLTQDLNVLLNLSNDWAFKINMELSRGSDPFGATTDDGELRKRFLGGVAVKF